MTAGSSSFPRISPEDVLFIAKYGVTRSYRKNIIVIHEGDEGDALYVILEGKVKVFVSDETGKEVVLGVQGPCDYFGDLALIDRAPRSASVMTTEPTSLAYVSRADFERCLHDEPAIAMKLISSLTQRIRILTDLVKDLALLSVRDRVIHILSKLAIPHDEKLTIDQRLTHQEIANMAGASREMVSRIMKSLANEGYIDTRGRTVTIEDRLVSKR